MIYLRRDRMGRTEILTLVKRRPRVVKRRPLPVPAVLQATVPSAVPSAEDPIMTEMRTRVVPAMRALHQGISKRDPGARGKLAVHLSISEDGKVSEVKTIEDTLASVPLRRGVLALLSRWQFPRPPAGTASMIFPFIFA
jgi:hypothetical protein